jgi:hypothetical protein
MARSARLPTTTGRDALRVSAVRSAAESDQPAAFVANRCAIARAALRTEEATAKSFPTPSLSSYLDFFLPPFLPPFRLADLPALAIRAARDFDIPLRFRALYFFLVFTEAPAITSSSMSRFCHRKCASDTGKLAARPATDTRAAGRRLPRGATSTGAAQ